MPFDCNFGSVDGAGLGEGVMWDRKTIKLKKSLLLVSVYCLYSKNSITSDKWKHFK